MIEKKINLSKSKTVLLFLCILPVYLWAIEKYYYFNRFSFLPPLEKLLIRTDARGNGFFGARRNGNRHHSGIDLLAKTGEKVVASLSGRAYCGEIPRGMGKYVVIVHRNHFFTLYGHLSNISIKNEQMVRQGDIIGLIGKTGNAQHPQIRPHLHFEIRKNGVSQNPVEGYLFIAK